MRETNDGFRIAEEDLRLRGPGEILGTRQSGEEAFRVATAEDVAELAPSGAGDARCCSTATAALPAARGQAARICLYLFERDQAVGLLRSGAGPAAVAVLLLAEAELHRLGGSRTDRAGFLVAWIGGPPDPRPRRPHR